MTDDLSAVTLKFKLRRRISLAQHVKFAFLLSLFFYTRGVRLYLHSHSYIERIRVWIQDMGTG